MCTTPECTIESMARDETGPPEDPPMAPTAEGFVLSDCPAQPPSKSANTLVLQGRLQVYVASGSQYAIWRQFPGSVQYEIKLPTGEIEKTIDLSMNISDFPETYEQYAAETADRIIGKDYQRNIFDQLSRFIAEPGLYSVRAHYQGFASNWVDFHVAP